MKRKAWRRRPQQRNIIIGIADAGYRIQRQMGLQDFNAFPLGTTARGDVDPFLILKCSKRGKLRIDLHRDLPGLIVGFGIQG